MNTKNVFVRIPALLLAIILMVSCIGIQAFAYETDLVQTQELAHIAIDNLDEFPIIDATLTVTHGEDGFSTADIEQVKAACAAQGYTITGSETNYAFEGGWVFVQGKAAPNVQSVTIQYVDGDKLVHEAVTEVHASLPSITFNEVEKYLPAYYARTDASVNVYNIEDGIVTVPVKSTLEVVAVEKQNVAVLITDMYNTSFRAELTVTLYNNGVGYVDEAELKAAAEALYYNITGSETNYALIGGWVEVQGKAIPNVQSVTIQYVDGDKLVHEAVTEVHASLPSITFNEVEKYLPKYYDRIDTSVNVYNIENGIVTVPVWWTVTLVAEEKQTVAVLITDMYNTSFQAEVTVTMYSNGDAFVNADELKAAAEVLYYNIAGSETNYALIGGWVEVQGKAIPNVQSVTIQYVDGDKLVHEAVTEVHASLPSITFNEVEKYMPEDYARLDTSVNVYNIENGIVTVPVWWTVTLVAEEKQTVAVLITDMYNTSFQAEVTVTMYSNGDAFVNADELKAAAETLYYDITGSETNYALVGGWVEVQGKAIPNVQSVTIQYMDGDKLVHEAVTEVHASLPSITFNEVEKYLPKYYDRIDTSVNVYNIEDGVVTVPVKSNLKVVAIEQQNVKVLLTNLDALTYFEAEITITMYNNGDAYADEAELKAAAEAAGYLVTGSETNYALVGGWIDVQCELASEVGFVSNALSNNLNASEGSPESAPDTGDAGMIGIFVALLVLSGGVIAFLALSRKKIV